MRLILVPIVLTFVLALAACGGDDEPESVGGATTTTATTTTTTEQASLPADTDCETVDAPEAKPDGGQTAPTEALEAGATYELVVETNCGEFTITLDPEQAPKTGGSFKSLADKGFYDGTTFHRIVPGFVIQGGDPKGDGTGGPGYSVAEPPPKDLLDGKGVVAMAKTGAEPAGTSGSQFFVVTAPDAGLPPDYAIIGSVSEGMETVKAIEALGVGDGPPSQPVVIEKATVWKS